MDLGKWSGRFFCFRCTSFELTKFHQIRASENEMLGLFELGFAGVWRRGELILRGRRSFEVWCTYVCKRCTRCTSVVRVVRPL